jgi:hypothetical protein
MPTELEDQFHQAMIDIYLAAKRDCNYNATYFIQMVERHGGVETARRLLASDTPQTGFTVLWECERLDLSVEAQVLKPEYASLFTEAERHTARGRLAEYGYFPDQGRGEFNE